MWVFIKDTKKLVDKPPFEKPPIGLGFIPKDVEHVSKNKKLDDQITLLTKNR